MTAVEIRNGYKFYGRSSNPNKKIILNYLNMNVMRGSIYGLLGASGCGKTTLLSCIVGQRHLNSGEIRVFGLKPGEPGSGIPGPKVGYMPQEIALVEEMTVKETIYYFGRIYGLSEDRIYDRYKLLGDLLELPPSNQLVRKCSGGQQRRVSFACAMVHDPELLILDEPTVGLDPILREKIWNFLIEITKTSKVAVIITTHYIEEARQANCIGLMRNGILLAEDTPNNIMHKFECDTLEDAFLVLSQKQGKSEEADSTINILHNNNHNHQSVSNNKTNVPLSVITTVGVIDQISDTIQSPSDKNNVISNTTTTTTSIVERAKPLLKRNLSSSHDNHNNNQNHNNCHQKSTPAISSSSSSTSSPSLSTSAKTLSYIKMNLLFTTQRRMKALMTKNLVQLLRQPSGLLFMFLFPILQLTCFYLAVGNNPTDLNIGIVNYEVPDPNTCFNDSLVTVFNKNESCEFYKISCRYLNEFDETLAKKIYYETIDDAYAAARKTHIVGFLHFAHNFSESMQKLLEEGHFTDDDSIMTSQLNVRLDMSDQPIAIYIERGLRDTYAKFVENLMLDCNLPKELAALPVKFEEPIFGSFHEVYRTYIAPGVIMTMVFFLATLMTAAVFISERSDGVWDRTLVAGITTSEMLIAHIVFQTVIMTIQCFEVIVYIAFIFNPENKGDNFSVIALLVLTGFAGTLFGLLISVYCKSHTMANFIATGAFYPMIILCGLMWPLEGMPTLLRKIALIFPFTVPSFSIRNILQKGWSITNSQVYNGFLIMILWIILLFTCCIVGLKRKT